MYSYIVSYIEVYVVHDSQRLICDNNSPLRADSKVIELSKPKSLDRGTDRRLRKG